MKAYEEIVDFIAAKISPDEVLHFQASDEVKDRVADLIHREKTSGLSSDEERELQQYLQLEHVMRSGQGTRNASPSILGAWSHSLLVKSRNQSVVDQPLQAFSRRASDVPFIRN